MTAFVERTLSAIDTDGAPFDLTIRIDAPRPHQDDWACRLLVTELFEPGRDLHGVDSWQALQLAQRLAFTLLDAFVERGGRLLDFGEPTTPAALFASVEPLPPYQGLIDGAPPA